MLSQSLLWFVNLLIIVVFSGIDSSTHGFTNRVSDRLMRFWRKPFTRKRLQSTNYNSSKQLVPVVYLFRRPRLQDNLSGFPGLNGLSGSNVPGYVTISDDDLPEQDDSSNSQGLDPIIKGINNAVQSLGIPNLSSSGQSSDSKDPSFSFDQSDRIPIGGSFDFKPFDTYKKQIGPTGTFGHEFLGHGHGHHFPFHFFHPGFHHGFGDSHGKSKVHYIPMPYPYPVVHMKHIKHHQEHHNNDVSSWVWGILLAALLPILLGALLLPLGLLFGLSLLTLLAVAGGAGGGGTFIPINGTGTAVPAGRRKRSISPELWDRELLDAIESFILDCIQKGSSL
ncbi:uncharacterized protein LOC107371316 [Tetranychus urticae]|uniref:uncharacterized protein LOC107371316 n=1 Tax=Tetranychus urticae TaxID=32264 RepID=UPI00077BDD94|nr:uncharacterized protein LOC107371316 [Tetranychus urticae]